MFMRSHKGLNVNVGKISVRGGNVSYKRIFMENTRNNTPLLVIHGGPAVPHGYLEPLARLAVERPVIFYDQLGCGNSDKPIDDNLWQISRFVDEVEHVRTELGLSKIHILGHSWGGALAIEHALKKSSGILSLILASPLISVNCNVADSTRLVKLLPKDMGLEMLTCEAKGDFSSHAYNLAREEYTRRYLCRIHPMPELLSTALQAANGEIRSKLWGRSSRQPDGKLQGYDISNDLKSLSMDILVTCGYYDVPSPKSLATFIKGMKNAQLKIFEESGHMPHIEETEAYLDVVRMFIKNVEAKYQNNNHTYTPQAQQLKLRSKL